MAGANCHFDQVRRPVPVGVLTNLDGDILIPNELTPNTPLNTTPTHKWLGHYRPGQWVVSGARVMLTRFWASSTASIVLVPHMTSHLDYPDPLFGTPSPKSLPEEIRLEGEFCMWMGYLDKVRPVEKKDLEEGYLLRVFTGIFENIKFTGSGSGGYTIQLQARDRAKWLMDSDVYFNAQELQRNKPLARSDIIIEVAKMAVGSVTILSRSTNTNKCTNCGKDFKVDPNFIIDIAHGTSGQPKSSSAATVRADHWYSQSITSGSSTQPPPLAGSTEPSPLSISPDPEIRIHTTRQPIEVNKNGNFILNAALPIEVIKNLSYQEIYPTEFFMNHRDGHFYYAPRANDNSALEDGNRFYRTYYFNHIPKTAADSQKLIALRQERSSIGLRTNFIVSANAPFNAGRPHDDFLIHVRAYPHSFAGLDFACKFHRVHDPSIQGIEDAALVAAAMARIWAREVDAASTVMLGDPSLVPGEVVQVFGSPLLYKGGLDRQDDDRTKYKDFAEAYNELIEVYAKTIQTRASQSKSVTQSTGNKNFKVDLSKSGGGIFGIGGKKQQSVEADMYDGSTLKVELAPTNDPVTAMEEILCRATDAIFNKGNQIGFEEPPLTIYRIDAVHHKLNQGTLGFQTELALTTPF